MKKVLIITYYWPPSGGAGVQRWLKFVKYLPEFGIEPIVLTVDPNLASYPQKDESLCNEISKDCKVFTTKTFELYNLYKFFNRKKEIPYGGFANEKKPGLLQKIMRALRSHLLLPDPRKGWNKYAYQKAVELIKTYQIDTVITTSPPHSTQLIGLKLKRKLNVRWIADLRDPWTDIYYYKDLYHSPLSKAFDKKLEKDVLRNADNVVTVSDALKTIFAGKLPIEMKDKIKVIPNGFDTSDFDYTILPNNETFTISYTGTITEEYPISSFLEALKQFIKKYQNIKVRFVGKSPTSLIELTKEMGISEYFEFVGYVPHKQSVKQLMQSHALLLIIPNVGENKGILTGKLFEYIGSGRKIIALGPIDGDASAIINKSESGKMFSYTNTKEIISYLEELYTEYIVMRKNQEVNTNNLVYSRRELTNEMNKLILK